jgi:hypothetical protein
MRALLLAAVTLALTTTVSMAQKASTATTASVQPTPSGRHLSTEEADALVHRGGGGVAPAPSNRVRCYDRQRRAGANACQAAVRCNLDYAYSGALCI